MMVALKNQSKKPEKEIKDLAEKGGLLIKDDDKSVQNIWKSFQKYLHQNPKATEKIMGLIGATSPEGSEQEVELTLEQRIRAKIQKILRESFVILKEDEVDILDTDLSQQIKIVGDEAKRYELADMDDENSRGLKEATEWKNK